MKKTNSNRIRTETILVQKLVMMETDDDPRKES